MIHGRRALRQALVPALLSWLAVSAYAAAFPEGRQAPATTAQPTSVTARAAARRAAGQAAGPWNEVLRLLAARLAAALGRSEPANVVGVDQPGVPAGQRARLQDEFVSQLRARGVRTATPGESIRVEFGCGENVRDRLCSADVVRADRRTIFVAARPRDASAGSGEAPRMLTALSMRPLLALPAPILDTALIDERRLLLLGTNGLTLFEKRDEAWSPGETLPIASGVPWPRDPRGRLVVRGNEVAAFAAGRTCSGTLNPFAVSCAERRGAWPLPIENEGLADGRNYFTSAHTAPFYAAASLSPTGGAPWLLAGVNGRLRFVDAAPAPTADLPQHAGDLVALGGSCAARGPLVLTSSEAGPNDVPVLRLFEVDENQLLPVGPPLALSGPVSALWPTEDPSAALLVCHTLGMNRYEAFLVGLSCAR